MALTSVWRAATNGMTRMSENFGSREKKREEWGRGLAQEDGDCITTRKCRLYLYLTIGTVLL
jgi:hypothetical protein